MNTTYELLQQLHIDRDEGRQASNGIERRRWLAAAIVAALVTGSVAGWIAAGPGVAPEWTHAKAPAHPEARASSLQPPTVASSAHTPSVRTGPAPAARAALDASGYVVARRQATVSSKATGRVVEVLIEEGQRVEQGQVIARLDASGTTAALAEAAARLAQAQADLDAARIAAEDARPIFRRNEQQYARALISSQAFDAARAAYNATQAGVSIKARAVDVARAGRLVAERNHDDTVIRAPFSGIVTVKAAQPGEIVSPLSASSGFARTGIGTIVDMESMEVEVDVSESFIALVHPGQDALVRLNAYPDLDIAGETVAVIPAVDRSKATVRVRVRFKRMDPRILPDMGVKVTFLAA
jgi:RND family efflux transporter MFP subunit